MKRIYVLTGYGGEGKTSFAETLIDEREAVVIDDFDSSHLDDLRKAVASDGGKAFVVIANCVGGYLMSELRSMGASVTVLRFEGPFRAEGERR